MDSSQSVNTNIHYFNNQHPFFLLINHYLKLYDSFDYV